jgi:transposase
MRGHGDTKVRVLGVDDWAWRKRQSYGTMLMDLEQQRVIDLLPVRSAGSFADWLGKHPEVLLPNVAENRPHMGGNDH